MQLQMAVTLHTPGGHAALSPGQPMASHGDPRHGPWRAREQLDSELAPTVGSSA